MKEEKKLCKVEISGSFFLFILTIVAIVLRLTGVIDWSWLWVLAPLWIPIAFVAGFFAVVLVTILVAAIIDVLT